VDPGNLGYYVIATDGEKFFNDIIFVTSSDGQVLLVEPPPRPATESSTVYWKQKF
jgi:ssDNA-specific exonuclease RecJ